MQIATGLLNGCLVNVNIIEFISEYKSIIKLFDEQFHYNDGYLFNLAEAQYLFFDNLDVIKDCYILCLNPFNGSEGIVSEIIKLDKSSNNLILSSRPINSAIKISKDFCNTNKIKVGALFSIVKETYGKEF